MPNEVTPQTTDQPVAAYQGPTGIADNITSQDLRLPRVALLQPLSPIVQRDGEKYKPGAFVNTLTQDVLATPVRFTPCFIFKNVIKWKPRSEGGGMIYKTTKLDDKVLQDLQWDGPNKPAADQYINAVCLIEGQETPVVISFCKTSLKTGQDLATLCQLSGYAWKYSYLLTAEKVTNTKGTFYVFRVSRGSVNEETMQKIALEMFESVKTMSIETDYEHAHDNQAARTTTEPTEF